MTAQQHDELVRSQVTESNRRFSTGSGGRKPPVDPATGKLIPRSSWWGFDRVAWSNTKAMSLTFDICAVSCFLVFNASQIGRDFYHWLNANYTPFQIDFYWTFGITTVLYWAFAVLYAVVDLTSWPAAVFQYKVQPFQRVGFKEYGKIAVRVLWNQALVTLPLAYFKARLKPSDARVETLPGPLTSIAVIIFNILCTEIGFFYVHRFLHSPGYYQKYHKQHHEYTAPVGLAATYCTAVEHLFSNLLPNTIGTTITQCHWSLTMFTFCFLEIETIMAHSGYNLPFTHSSLNHDFHHFAFNENFGPIGLLDGWYGTNKKFIRALEDAKVRHRGDEGKARAELLSKIAEADLAAANQGREAKKDW
ncbi:sterol desaturase [Tilletiaria anomala UBC 951]|uniref:Sterol desaturase n=1 Tax=Tilletiaria anomala (strain ATCC 24038 / CBS 436.72 / UBC 951) TaxID=1037660 RepID=A0A066VUW5_TILAU|nr:sterol desaturase [Tilletiaria anomala UBC 951]KDN45271.1 sterol desaturase [Tilletiaria anomala UBC 951]